jgi:thiol:disulfide interchange protein
MNPPPQNPKPANTTPKATQKQWPWRFILIITVLATGVALASYIRNNAGTNKIAWRYSFNQANTEAKKNGKPLLVYFTADWCGPCKQMKTWVFSDDHVAQSIEAAFVPVKIDLTTEGLPDQHLADRYNVTGIPTFLTLTHAGKQISMSSGAFTKDQLLAWLDNANQRYAELNAQQADATALVEESQEH